MLCDNLEGWDEGEAGGEAQEGKSICILMADSCCFMAEANTGKGLKVKNWMRFYMTYILPVIIIVLFVVGILDKFGII